MSKVEGVFLKKGLWEDTTSRNPEILQNPRNQCKDLCQRNQGMQDINNKFLRETWACKSKKQILSHTVGYAYPQFLGLFPNSLHCLPVLLSDTA